jgi:hypothetical protein
MLHSSTAVPSCDVLWEFYMDLFPLERDPTLATTVQSTLHSHGKLALAQAVLDPVEAISIGPRPVVLSRGKSASIGPQNQILAAAAQSDAIRQISKKK